MKKSILFPLLALILSIGLVQCQNDTKTTNVNVATQKKVIKPADEKKAPQQEDKKMDDSKNVKILISTEYGDMTAILYNETSQHKENFIKLINEGWFNNSPFHRVINQFMIQGGHNKDGKVDPGYTVPAEFYPHLYHKKGALAAARQGDQVNPAKASSGCQFYIVQGKTYNDAELNGMEMRVGTKYTPEQRKMYMEVGGTPFLDMNYTVFGEVIDGFDVIDKIAAVETGKMDKPVKNVVMNISILEE